VLLVLSVVVDVVLGASLSRYQGVRSAYPGKRPRRPHFNHPLATRSRLHPRKPHAPCFIRLWPRARAHWCVVSEAISTTRLTTHWRRVLTTDGVCVCTGSGSGAVERGVYIEPPTTSQIRLPLEEDDGDDHAQPTPEFVYGGRWGQLRATAQLTDAPTASCHAVRSSARTPWSPLFADCPVPSGPVRTQ